jgi:hypothetical protein
MCDVFSGWEIVYNTCVVYIWLWEYMYEHVFGLHMIENICMLCDCLTYDFAKYMCWHVVVITYVYVCELLHEHVWNVYVRWRLHGWLSVWLHRGQCLCDCPIYAKIENMLMHFIVGDSICVASPGVCVCVATPNPAGFYWVGDSICVASPGDSVYVASPALRGLVGGTYDSLRSG